MPSKHIGHLITNTRKKLGMKADDVAELCNVSRSRVYSWERSTSVLPKNLKSLSMALKIPLKRLQAENEVPVEDDALFSFTVSISIPASRNWTAKRAAAFVAEQLPVFNGLGRWKVMAKPTVRDGRQHWLVMLDRTS